MENVDNMQNTAATVVFATRTVCPACNSPDRTEIYSARFVEDPVLKFFERKFENKETVLRLVQHENYVLQKCENCTLVYQSNILSDLYLAKLYDEWLINHDAEKELGKEKTGLGDSLYYAQEVLKLIKYLNRHQSEIDVLDYGMGRGWWVRMAMALGCNAYGTDLSSALIEDAQSRGINTIRNEELEQHKFDFINTEQVFEHLANPLEVLKRLRRTLNEKGIVKISVPDGRSIEKDLRFMDWTAPRNSKRYLMPITPLIHINTFNYQSIVTMGKCAGFKPISIPLRHEYCLISGLTVRDLMKTLVRPIYRRIRKPTYVFLQFE